jgi:hypothetical protein
MELIKKVKQCQTEHKVYSCLKCDKCFKCELRKEYVIGVYKSMNKDFGNNKAGFEF